MAFIYGLADEGEEAMKALTATQSQTLTTMDDAEAKKATMAAQAQDATAAIEQLPKALGIWGLIFIGGAYWFVLRPLLK